MIENKKYNRYKELKNKLFFFDYKDYPLDLVLGSYLARMVWQPSIRLFVSYFLFNVKDFPNLNSGDTILTYSTKRNDYYELMSRFFPNIIPQYVRIESTGNGKVNNLFESIRATFRATVFLRNVKCKINDKIILVLGVSLAFKVIDEIEKKDIKCKRYIAFNSSYLIESFLSYYFRKRKIQTYSLQHGIYFDYINEKPIDVINYENVCANEIIMWGEYSKREVENIIPSSSRCKVYGYPVEDIPERMVSKAILVLLPRKIYLKECVELIEYLKKFDEEYIVRSHPSIISNMQEMELYKNNISIDNNSSLKETLLKYRYRAVIGFNSTALFEASLYKQKVLLFKTDNQEFRNPGFKEIDINSSLSECVCDIGDKVGSEYFFKKIEASNKLC
ncbi:hypothetical protein [Vibrio sp. 10N.261.51.F12]|uniref:hypothetical protein n=1 Tax=Vibrio sp. 10N.261.51.F12 TaxID=3229679 RepID=UPI00354B4F1B